MIDALKESLYTQQVSPPEITPFNKRDYGILCGTIQDNLKPVDALAVTLVREDKTEFSALTSGAGYYAFSKVPAGSYTLKSKKHGVLAETVKIKNGKITTTDINLNELE